MLIQSELPLPYLPSFSGSIGIDTQPVSINFGAVSSEGIPNPLQIGLCFQATKQLFWLSIPSIGRFLIMKGNTIIIDPLPGIDEDSLRAFILDIGLAMLLMQRDVFALRGGAIKLKEQGIVFLAQTGTGLSTLIAALHKRGYPIVTDKMCVINSLGHVLPGLNCIELWSHVADAIGFEKKSLTKVRGPLNKYFLPIVEHAEKTSLQTKAIYVLTFHPEQMIRCTPLMGVQKIQYLQQALYKQAQFRALINNKAAFQHCVALSNQIDLIALHRPAVEYPLDQLVHHLEQDWVQRGFMHG